MVLKVPHVKERQMTFRLLRDFLAFFSLGTFNS